jgi:uncharacterized protein YjiS (DUF1127 family)
MSSVHCKVSATVPAVPFAAGSGFVHTVLLGLTRGVNILLDWQVRAAQRRHLAELPDHVLKDVGLSRADVARETTKPFWAS